MTSALLRSDALRLPLADGTVDLVVTSPPYFSLRSYRDGDEHYAGQLGSEATPQAFIEALLVATAEMARVLKPSGSIFVNLGDKYAGSGGHNNNGLNSSTLKNDGRPKPRPDTDRQQKLSVTTRRNAPDRYNQDSGGIPTKSLMLLPERYRIGCVDRLGLIARAVICWSKPNGLPESVTDRVRRSHEDWVHLTKEPRYYSAVDQIREQYAPASESRSLGPVATPYTANGMAMHGTNGSTLAGQALHPLGKLPGSVWTVATEPLRVPDWVGVDHFAAFPTEFPRRLVLGWSPSGVCVECGEGRRPVVEDTGRVVASDGRDQFGAYAERRPRGEVSGPQRQSGSGTASMPRREQIVTGEACACPAPDAPTRPAVVLDPFCGTGTTIGVARSLGRYGVGVDLSKDYLRLARWRVWESGHFAKAVARTWRERQGGLFDGEDAA